MRENYHTRKIIYLGGLIRENIVVQIYPKVWIKSRQFYPDFAVKVSPYRFSTQILRSRSIEEAVRDPEF